jgi:tetratricopeptide (TPR) repeat protein
MHPMAHGRAILLSLLLLAAAPAQAGMTEAWDAYDHHDYGKAADLFRAEANRGDSEAQYMLGQLYDGELLGPRDVASAAQWFEKAAAQGHPDAQNSLGYYYDFGLGVPRDRGKAAMWYERSAAGGSIAGRNNIAFEWAQMGQRLEEALGYANDVVSKEPKIGAYQDTLGWTLYRLKRFADSVPPLCRAAKLDPGSPEIHSHLGDAFWHVGLQENARMQWQQAFDLAKTYQLLSPEGKDFLYAEGEPFKQAMQERLARGPGDGAAPDKPDQGAIEGAITAGCTVPTS